jgi:hypothetical protein
MVSIIFSMFDGTLINSEDAKKWAHDEDAINL